MKVKFFTSHYGFVVDYVAEALRELRKHTFTELLDRHFSLASQDSLEVAGDIVERVDPVFFSDPKTAAMKALGIT